MKILFTAHYAGSVYHGMEFRPYYISKELVKQGHEVVIVAASYSHLRQKNPSVTSAVTKENIDGVSYAWLKTPAYKGNGAGRVRNMLSFVRGLYKYLPEITAGFTPDAVIASSTYPLDVYPASRTAKKHNAKFVFELHDLWPMTPMLLGRMSKRHPFIAAMQAAEDYWCRNADVVISLLDGAYKHLVTRGMDMKKYRVIANGVDLSEWLGAPKELPEPHKSAIEKLKQENKTLVGYVGGFAVSNALGSLLSAAEKLKSESGLRFVLVGKGQEKEKLEAKAKEMNLSNVAFLPPIEKKFVPSLLESFDILTCFASKTPLYEYGTSFNKIYDYMAAGKPVIWSNDRGNIIDACGSGVTVRIGDTGAYCEKLLELSAADKEKLSEMGRRGREYIVKNATYEILAGKFIEALGGKQN